MVVSMVSKGRHGNEGRSMNCNNTQCRHSRTDVIRTEHKADGLIRRIRECRVCHHRFSTDERVSPQQRQRAGR